MRDQLIALCTSGKNPFGPAHVILVPATGCEAFAKMIYEVTEQWLHDAGFSPRCSLVSVEVFEHGSNSAIYEPPGPGGPDAHHLAPTAER